MLVSCTGWWLAMVFLCMPNCIQCTGQSGSLIAIRRQRKFKDMAMAHLKLNALWILISYTLKIEQKWAAQAKQCEFAWALLTMFAPLPQYRRHCVRVNHNHAIIIFIWYKSAHAVIPASFGVWCMRLMLLHEYLPQEFCLISTPDALQQLSRILGCQNSWWAGKKAPPGSILWTLKLLDKENA